MAEPKTRPTTASVPALRTLLKASVAHLKKTHG